MDKKSEHNALPETSEVIDMIAIASRLVGREGITAVHVVASQRPSYDEILRFRFWANAHDLELKVGALSVSFRSRLQPDIGDRKETASQNAWPARLQRALPRGVAAMLRRVSNEWPATGLDTASRAVDRLRLQTRIWQAELNALSEGTR